MVVTDDAIPVSYRGILILISLTAASLVTLNHQWLGSSRAIAHSGHSHTQDSTQEVTPEVSEESLAEPSETVDDKSIPMSSEHSSDGMTMPSSEIETDEQSSEQLIQNTQPVQVSQVEVNLSSGFPIGLSESMFIVVIIAPFLLTALRKRLQS